GGRAERRSLHRARRPHRAFPARRGSRRRRAPGCAGPGAGGSGPRDDVAGVDGRAGDRPPTSPTGAVGGGRRARHRGARPVGRPAPVPRHRSVAHHRPARRPPRLRCPRRTRPAGTGEPRRRVPRWGRQPPFASV
ncbi:MAG: hypothetical protein AVDCRST_MAG20-2890, partial [uncultured Acidimicrobiales bacterium]